jgi:polysaccharide pyruvyl transferase WcaK-like protein
MEFAGMYGVEKTTSIDYAAYLQTLVNFVAWLLTREYKVRLLIGDIMDTSATRKFSSLLNERLTIQEDQVIDEPAESTEDLLQQLAATDFVVATRFHNILLALLLDKPVVAISFHHKCSSLMRQMGLSEYCQDIKHLRADRLIEQFRDMERNAERLKASIRRRTQECRTALDEQYDLIFRGMFASHC